VRAGRGHVRIGYRSRSLCDPLGTVSEVGSGASVTPKEILALWDRAVAMHREYWHTLDYGKMTETVRKADTMASCALMMATELSCPDAVANGR